jgi:RimJ/RimL family protein N-acetyltransferase
MSQLGPVTVDLVHLDLTNLRRLATAEPLEIGNLQVADGALPHSKTVARALDQLDQGTPALWCIPFLIVSSHQSVVGRCGFKTAPAQGRVEIHYGVAGNQRGRGIATAAVGQLLHIAAASGMVQQVAAQIVPDNAASSKVVSRLGFTSGHPITDPDGEIVVPWTWRPQPDDWFKPFPLRDSP